MLLLNWNRLEGFCTQTVHLWGQSYVTGQGDIVTCGSVAFRVRETFWGIRNQELASSEVWLPSWHSEVCLFEWIHPWQDGFEKQEANSDWMATKVCSVKQIFINWVNRFSDWQNSHSFPKFLGMLFAKVTLVCPNFLLKWPNISQF